MSDQVKIGRDGAVQTVRLNRPEKKNALTGQMYAVWPKPSTLQTWMMTSP